MTRTQGDANANFIAASIAGQDPQASSAQDAKRIMVTAGESLGQFVADQAS